MSNTAKAKGVTAAYLMQKSNRHIVSTICDDLVKVIDTKIQTAHQNGFSEMEQDLPINFNINGMPRQDAQTLIYSELIQIYKDKGFDADDIGLTFGVGGTAQFHIRWLNGMDDTERDQRKQLIAKHMWRTQKSSVASATKRI